MRHCFASPSPCRSSPALLACCGRVSPLPSRGRPVVPPGPARALFLPRGREGAFPSLSWPRPWRWRPLPGPAGRERAGAGAAELPPFHPCGPGTPPFPRLPSRAVGSEAAFDGSGLSCFPSCLFFSAKARWRRLSKSYTLCHLEVCQLQDHPGVPSPWLGGVPEFCFKVNLFLKIQAYRSQK